MTIWESRRDPVRYRRNLFHPNWPPFLLHFSSKNIVFSLISWLRNKVIFQKCKFWSFWKVLQKGDQFLSCRCIFESVKTSKIWKFTVFSPIPSRFFILQTFEKLYFHKKWHRTLSVFFIKSSFFRRTSLIFAWFVLVESSMI